MKKATFVLAATLAGGIGIGNIAARTAKAEDPLKTGTILQRTQLVNAKGYEGILVLRDLPPGGESGKHTQTGNEIVYIVEGSVILEVQGKAPVTVKAGEAFQTVAGEVHNVKNASATARGKALAFYVAKTGTGLEGLSLPTK